MKKAKIKIKGIAKEEKTLTQMTYKDLKKAAVERGMPFEDVITADFFKLNSYVHLNSFKKPDKQLVEQFDDWMEQILLSKGQEQLVHPSLRLSYIGSTNEDDNTIEKKREIKPKPVAKAKVKRTKNEDGIYGGTKKALTFALAKKGRSIERTIAKVKRKFPDAADKSIKIWYKKALKEMQ